MRNVKFLEKINYHLDCLRKPDADKQGILSRHKYESGNFVSVDQFMVKNPGRLTNGYGLEGPNSIFHGGNIYNVSKFGVIWIKNKLSLGYG